MPLSRTPELHYGQISTTQKDGTPPFPRRNAHSRTLYSTWSLLLDAQSSCVVLLVVLGLVRCLRWKMEKPASCQTCGNFPAPEQSERLSCHVSTQPKHLTCHVSTVTCGLLERLTARWCQKVWRQSWRTARNLIRLGTKCWVNSLGVMWEQQHCWPLWAPVRPASWCRILLVSLLQVSTPLSLVGLLAFFPCAKHTARCLCRNSR